MSKYTNADLFMKTFNGMYATELWSLPEKDFLEWLNAPTADVAEVRHGQWINDNHLIKCSICRGPIPINKVVIGGKVMWENNCSVNYCPNCGAKMDLREDE